MNKALLNFFEERTEKISIPAQLIKDIQDVIKHNPGLGYKSATEFIIMTARRELADIESRADKRSTAKR